MYYNYWLPAGAEFDNGIAVYEGRYLIACTSTFGNVGDKVDFFLEDEACALELLQSFVQKPVHLEAEPAYTQEQYDVLIG